MKQSLGLALALLCFSTLFVEACSRESTAPPVTSAVPTTETQTTTTEEPTTTTEPRTTTTVVRSAWGTPVEVEGLRITVDEPLVNEDFVVKWREDVWYDSVLLVPVTVEGVGPSGGYLSVDLRFGLIAGAAIESPEEELAQPPLEYDASLLPEYEPIPSGMVARGTVNRGWLVFGRKSSDKFMAVEYQDGWFDDSTTPRGGAYQWNLYWEK